MHRLINEKSNIFIVGAPFSGKSTISSILLSQIEGVTNLPMDIVRIFAQILEKKKPKASRNKFVELGSCDCYELINDGKPTDKNIIDSYKIYSKSVFEPLKQIMPKLEAQGCEHLIIDGVQLMPELIAPYLGKYAKLIIITSCAEKFISNKQKVIGTDKALQKRYSNDTLNLIQTEILKQARELDKNNYTIVENTGNVEDCTDIIIDYLKKIGFIQ